MGTTFRRLDLASFGAGAVHTPPVNVRNSQALYPQFRPDDQQRYGATHVRRMTQRILLRARPVPDGAEYQMTMVCVTGSAWGGRFEGEVFAENASVASNQSPRSSSRPR